MTVECGVRFPLLQVDLHVACATVRCAAPRLPGDMKWGGEVHGGWVDPRTLIVDKKNSGYKPGVDHSLVDGEELVPSQKGEPRVWVGVGWGEMR